jgi:hypothetical protein
MGTASSTLKELNLGCGNLHNADPQVVHHDQTMHHPDIRLTFDLDDVDGTSRVQMWGQYEDGRDQFRRVRGDERYLVQFEHINAKDVLEHTEPKNFFKIMEFCWQNLIPGGTMYVQVPQHGSPNHTIDPTHYRGFQLESFHFLDPLTSIGRRNRFYGNSPWKLEQHGSIPNTTINLRFLLRKLLP